MFPSAKAWKRFTGIMSSRTSASEGTAPTASSTGAVSSIPAPGCRSAIAPIPAHSATRSVATNHARILAASRPNARTPEWARQPGQQVEADQRHRRQHQQPDEEVPDRLEHRRPLAQDGADDDPHRHAGEDARAGSEPAASRFRRPTHGL